MGNNDFYGVINSGRAVITAMKTTIWRPNVRVTLDEYGEVEDTESEGEELTKKGTKRKRAPPTKGPCEHGVKYRSMQGVQRLSAREAAALQGVRWGINLRARSSAPHARMRRASICEHRAVQGVRWVWNLRARSSAL